jgi:hypothetical protein
MKRSPEVFQSSQVPPMRKIKPREERQPGICCMEGCNNKVNHEERIIATGVPIQCLTCAPNNTPQFIQSESFCNLQELRPRCL